MILIRFHLDLNLVYAKNLYLSFAYGQSLLEDRPHNGLVTTWCGQGTRVPIVAQVIGLRDEVSKSKVFNFTAVPF